MSRLFVVALVLGGLAALYLLRFQPSPSQDLMAARYSDSEDHPFSLLQEPYSLPEIRFVDASNRPLTLSDFQGQVLLLNIWATWCPPCREEMPALDRLQQRLGDREFLVIPLSTDLNGLTAVDRFYREAGISSLNVYLDQNGEVNSALKVPGLPATYLIDREGRALGVKLGPAEWDSDGVVALIERYL